MGDGLLLTCLWYVRTVDEQTMLMTGLTRDGVYVVRGGEVVGATTNFRFNDSPAAMLGRVVDAGAAAGLPAPRARRLPAPRPGPRPGRRRLPPVLGERGLLRPGRRHGRIVTT